MFQKYKKAIVTASTIIIAICSIFGGLWAFENHYATNKVVDMKIEKVEFEVAGAIQDQQTSIQNQQIRTDYKFYQFMYDKLTQDMNNIRRELRRDPDNQELRQDYVDIKNERQKVKDKMDIMMEKIQ